MRVLLVLSLLALLACGAVAQPHRRSEDRLSRRQPQHVLVDEDGSLFNIEEQELRPMTHYAEILDESDFSTSGMKGGGGLNVLPVVIAPPIQVSISGGLGGKGALGLLGGGGFGGGGHHGGPGLGGFGGPGFGGLGGFGGGKHGGGGIPIVQPVLLEQAAPAVSKKGAGYGGFGGGFGGFGKF